MAKRSKIRVLGLKSTGLLFLILVFSACATAPRQAGVGQTQNDGNTGVYRESSANIQNEAPKVFSMPDSSSVPTIDAIGMREQADYHFSLAEAYSLEGNSVKATEEYKHALLYDSHSAQIRLRLATEYMKQSLVTEALEQGKLALEDDPKLIEAYLLMGGIESALRMYEDALKSYHQALALDPDSSEAAMFIGALLAEQKHYDESLKVFEKLAKSPRNPQPHLAFYYLGRVRLEQDVEKNKKSAEAAFKQAIAAKPSFVDAVSALGTLYEATGREPQAYALYKNFQQEHGPDIGIAENLSRLAIERKDFTLALDQLQVLEGSDSDNLSAEMKIAFILIEQEKYHEAIVKLQDILGKAPDSDKVHFYLGAVYEEVKDYASAINSFSKITVSSSYYPEAVVHKAYLHKMNGELDQAIQTVEAGIKTKDDYPQFYALYASFLDEQKDVPKALQVLTQATQKFPDHAQLRFFFGSMQDRSGDYNGMLESMHRVLQLDANHVQALNYLAYTLAEHGTQLDEAERLVRKALSLQPKDGYIMDTLGWVLFKRGNLAESIRVLEAAYKLVPSEAVIAEHLGDVYNKLQLPEKARKMYIKASQADGSPDNVRKMQSKLSAMDHQVQPRQLRVPASVPDQGGSN